MNFDLMRSLLIDRALRGELSAYSNSVAAEEKSLNEQKTKPFQIPYDWQWKCVADCVQFNPKVIQDDTAEVSFIPMADVEPGFVDQCSTRQTKLWAKVKKGFSRFQEGDLLVAKITPCFQNRKSCVAKNLTNGTGAGSTEFHVMRCVSGVDAKFLLFFFKSEYFIRYGVNHFNGTVGQQRVGTQDIKDCLVPVPPFEEQTRIVEKLEAAFVEIDRAEKAYEELQTLAGVLRGQILQEAIQGKLVPQLAEEGVVEHIGAAPEKVPFTIPESWKWTTLNAIGKWKAGGTPSRSIPEYYGGEIPWLKTGDLTDGLITSVEEYITRAGVENSSAHINPAGAVLIAMYGATIGKLGVLAMPCATNQACCACAVNEELVDKWYLFYYLLSQRTGFLQLGAGGAQPNISKTKIVNYPIPVPPIKEQSRIVAAIEKLLKQVDALSAR